MREIYKFDLFEELYNKFRSTNMLVKNTRTINVIAIYGPDPDRPGHKKYIMEDLHETIIGPHTILRWYPKYTEYWNLTMSIHKKGYFD